MNLIGILTERILMIMAARTPELLQKLAGTSLTLVPALSPPIPRLKIFDLSDEGSALALSVNCYCVDFIVVDVPLLHL